MREIPVILYAPSGWGKTHRAEELREQHRCTSVVDPWHPCEPLTPGALHLTSAPIGRWPSIPQVPHHYIACIG